MENSEAVFGSRLIITQLEIPVSTVKTIADNKKAGNTFILNPSPIDPDQDYDEILKKVDILIPNEIEAAQLSGTGIKSKAEIKKAAEKLIEKGVKNLVITLGEDGAMVFNEMTSEHIPPEKVKAVDSEGAGDVFTGAFVYFYSKTPDILRSASFANKIASISVTRYGAQKSIPTTHEIKEISKLF
jgi:ribokinase